MTALSREQDLELLRRALRATTGDDELDEMVRGSMYAHIARDPEKARVFREETAPLQAMADIHLGGAGVDGHLTSARQFAKFITRLSEATKFTARAIAGTPSYNENLLIEGVAPGSVRVVLRVPDGSTATASVSDDVIVDTPDSSALKKILGVLTLASTDEDTPGSDDLLAAMHGLPLEARTRLNGAAAAVISAKWDIEGTVQQRRQPEETVHVTPRGAKAVRSALKFNPGAPVEEQHLGVFDGLKRSLRTVYFNPVGARGFAAAVVHDELLHDVAELLTEPGREVVAQFAVRFDSGAEGTAGRKIRELVRIEPDDVPTSRDRGEQGRLGI